MLLNAGISKARLPQRHFRLAHMEARLACIIYHDSANQTGARAHGSPNDHAIHTMLQKLSRRTVMLGLRPRLSVVRLVKTAMSVAGKGHCRLNPRISKRSSVLLAVQIWPGKLHQLVNSWPSLALRVFQSEHTAPEPLQQLRACQARLSIAAGDT